MPHIAVCTDLTLDEPLAYFVIDQGGEDHVYCSLSEAEAAACEFAEAAGDDDWPIFPLWPGDSLTTSELDGGAEFAIPA